MREDLRWISKATRLELAGRVQYHIRCGPGDVAPHCLLPGDPAPLGFGGYWQSRMDGMVEDLHRAQILNSEMGGSTVLVLARPFGLRASSVLAVVANRTTDTFEYKGVEDCCRVSVEAVKFLAHWDDLKRKHGKARWYPSLGPQRYFKNVNRSLAPLLHLHADASKVVLLSVSHWETLYPCERNTWPSRSTA